MSTLSGRNILMIGGNSGIGAALHQRLTAEGAGVFCASRSANDSAAGEDRTLIFDATSPEADSLADFAPKTLHGVVYCPGSITLKPFKALKLEDFRSDFEINVLGAVTVLQAVLPALRRADDAAILFFSTVAVRTGITFHASVSSAKGAVEGLTRALAAEFAALNIRVNAIAPSITDTPMAASLLSSEMKRTASANRHPLKRIGDPKEVAALATLLLSPLGSWITGQVIRMDGGLADLRPL